tara:strand:- start:1821 stop:1979 length:159 start_codon:yes stop_codon:yes gene_type:complete
MKKVVTGHDANGKSVFLEAGEADHVINAPGIVWHYTSKCTIAWILIGVERQG